METETQTPRGKRERCPYCDTEMSVRGLGSHKANCPKNPERWRPIDGVAVYGDGKLRARVQRQANQKLTDARLHLGTAYLVLSEDRSEMRSVAEALQAVEEAQKALDARDAFMQLLDEPELKARNGKK